MPRNRSVTVSRLENIVNCLTPAVASLNELHDAFGTPFVQAISSTTLALITAVQTVKRNKEECIQLMEDIHGLLYAVINIHTISETKGTLRPETMYQIGKFTETLYKIHAFVEAQQDGNKIKHFFRHSEMNLLLKNCHAGLQEAIETFKVETDVGLFTDIASVEDRAQKMNMQLLELISALSDANGTDKSSSRNTSSNTSSESFSMLPAIPKIFHGREWELGHIIKALDQDSCRIAILGAGGMGKTSLANAVLHDLKITEKYQSRFFVACDSATNSIELAALIGSHLGLKPGKDLTKAVVHYFSSNPPCLLVLDNMETPWEPVDSRPRVEAFLALLAAIPHLALIITMRGAERPAQVQWSHPFLPPLGPLPTDAARQTFMDITDNVHNIQDMDKLLLLTDNMPLAVNLIAHLVDYEGCDHVLNRWETEKTSLLSEGYDKTSNLNASIMLSLSSSRMTSLPGGKELLSLLSILPDGLSDIELLQSDLPITNILACKAALLRISLAYTDHKMRLRVLVPIREHMQQLHPPSQHLVQAIYKHFHLLLDFYNRYQGSTSAVKAVENITSNLGNIQSVLLQRLQNNSSDLSDTIHCTILLNRFSRITGRGCTTLMDRIPTVLPQPIDHRVEAAFITEVFASRTYYPIVDPKALFHQGQAHFHEFHDPVLESRFYIAVGNYYVYQANDIPTALQLFETSVSLCGSYGEQESTALISLASIKWITADYMAARMHAREAQRLCKLYGNLYNEARALHKEVLPCLALGDYKLCILLCHRARELLRLCGMSNTVLDYNIISSEAQVHLLKSEYAEAHKIYTETFNTTSPEQDPFNYAFCLLNIAEIDVIIGGSEQDVRQNLNRVKSTFNTMKYFAGLVYSETIGADLELREGNNMTAKILFKKGLSSSWKNNGEMVTYCLERLADISRWSVSDISWVSDWATVYLGYSIKSQNRLAIHKALCCLADVFLANRDEDTAYNLFIVALDGFTSMDVHRSRAVCMLRLGDILQHRREFDQAADRWREARPLFERSLQTKDLSEIDTRLENIKQTKQEPGTSGLSAGSGGAAIKG
ncbi:hypothetical protein C8R44DRAFT_806652 [Mycena epipterygia]|nr:hypothetical protein C8R44DRAFT_806652 [Mycena epipterygia]